MSKSDYIGIDYGLGRSNIDNTTGIRYGVISVHSITQAWYDSAEAYYGEPTCPECGGNVSSTSDDEFYGDTDYTKYHTYGCDDYVCHHCKHTLDSDSVYSEEALSWSFSDTEYEMSDCLDSDVIITKSPYYTYAQFCSPCVPGAGNLNTPVMNGVKTYCVSHDWFDDAKAPYMVYRVSDDSIVTSEKDGQ